MKTAQKTGFALLLITACGESVAQDVVTDAGELVHDAGELLKDAGTWLSDGGSLVADAGAREDSSADAQQEPPAEAMQAFGEVKCDAAYERVLTDYNGSVVFATETTTNYYAEVPLDTAGVTSVETRLCEREVFGTDPQNPACIDDPTKSSRCKGPIAVPARCKVTAEADLEDKLVRVYCGQKIVRVGMTGTTVTSGARFQTARVIVRRD
jgi:hypothetical protein